MKAALRNIFLAIYQNIYTVYFDKLQEKYFLKQLS